MTWSSSDNALVTPHGVIEPFNKKNHEFECGFDAAKDIVMSDLAEAFAEINQTLSYAPQGEVSLTVQSEYDQPNAWRPFSTRYDTFAYWEKWGLIFDPQYQYPASTDRAKSLTAIEPLLKSHGGKLLEIAYHGGVGDEPPWLDFRATFPNDNRVGQLIALSRIFENLIANDAITPSSPAGAFALVVSGMPDALLGQPESQWLEVKQKGYGLENDRQKHELALDLAAFANSETGGLLVVGLSTRKDSGGQDTISACHGCTPGSLNVDSYTEVVKHRVVPAIEGLDIRVVAHKDRHLLAALVPPQPQQFQPFLVRGGLISGDRVSGAAFTIPRRMGSEKWNMSAEAVHSQLVAARIALRGEGG
ncbi:hypothetical protein [Micromonospora sp. NPDC023888]|uniref:AlbA family DNA-binding domain-containing protein n=1 Tax=Micromonospora sp. NPDC023888 TaxID=3155607 RepID=UPI0033DC2B6E